MKNYYTAYEKEEKNQKKGLMITMFVHLAVISLAFFPLMSATPNTELEENSIEYVELSTAIIDDVDFVVNAEDQIRENESNNDSKTTDESIKLEPVPISEPQPETIPLETIEEEGSEVITSSDNIKATDVKTNDETIEETNLDPNQNSSNSGGVSSDENVSGGTSTNNTNVSGDGGNDNNLQEGVFGRKVMKRPNIKGLTKERGKVAIKVCISQEGTVIASKYLPKFTTIKDSKLIASAMRAVRYYKFDVDYTAPKKQWGKLTFIFDI
jgi:outer membrane biosynthesis protein TonB